MIEHRPGRVHCNADGVSRPVCKQCIGKTFTTPWIDEFERADECIAPLGMRALQFSSEYSNEDLRNLQDCDVPRLDVLNTANLCPAISVVGLFYLFYLLTVIMNFVCRCIFRLDFTRRFRCCMCVSGE